VRINYPIAILLALYIICTSAALGGDRNPDAGVRAGEPIRHQDRYGTLETFTYPDPITLKNVERVQYFYVRGTTFDVDDVDLETVRVVGTIPPYKGIWVQGDWLVTTAFVFRFLGAGGFRPITGDFEAPYTVEFDLVSGEHVVVEGEFALVMYPGDLTFDGIIDMEDLAVLSDYLYRGGVAPEVEGWSFPELMDLDHDGDVDDDDLEALEEILGAVSGFCGDRRNEAGAGDGELGRHRNRDAFAETFVEQSPYILDSSDVVLRFYVRGTWFDVDDVDLETVLVQGKIPAYAGITRRGDWIITTAFVVRFLDASGFRPIAGDFVAPYTVEFDLLSGEHVVAEGEFALKAYPGDLTLDGQANMDDLIFLADFLFRGGPACHVHDLEGMAWEISELMDIDRDGDVDEDDLDALAGLIGL